MRARVVTSLVVAMFCTSPCAGWCAWWTFSTQDGLTNNNVLAIAEDGEGALWFGTEAGLSRYDGANWRTFTTADGLAHDTVTGLLVDRNGVLWASTGDLDRGGVSRFDGTSWSTITRTAGIGSTCIIEDREGNLWFAGMVGPLPLGPAPLISALWRYDGTNWRQVTTADGIGSDHVRSLFMDHSGAIWIGTYGYGVSRYDGTTWRTFTQADGLHDNYTVVAICEDRSGILWAAHSPAGWLSRYDGMTWTSVSITAGACMTSLCAARNGGIWIGSRGAGCSGGGAVRRFDGLRSELFTPSSGLVSGDVLRVFEDRSGALWVGTTSGVSRFDGASWNSFGSTTDPLFTRGILEDSRGDIWCTHSSYSPSSSSGVSRYDGTSWRRFTVADGLDDGGFVLDMVMDRDGQIWVATRAGVCVTADGNSWRTFTTADGLASNIVAGLLADRAGRIWAGTAGHGVSRYDGVTWRTFTTADGLADNYGFKMLEDRTGAIWIGSRSAYSDTSVKGVSRYDGVNWRAFTLADGMANRYVSAFLEDRAGAIWCGGEQHSSSDGNGVSRFDGESWKTFTAADGLQGANRVITMLEDRTGGVWVGSYVGASRYDGSSWRTFTAADGLPGSDVFEIYMDRSGVLWFGTSDGGVSRYDGEKWTTFTAADGLGDIGAWTILEDSRGALWFGSDRLTRYYPDRVPPQTVFTSRPPRVSANTIPIIAYAAGFKEIEGIEFSYSLDGSPWSAWSVAASWPSRSLPHGEHVFEVKARDRLNNVDPTPARAEFEIDAMPPVPAIVVPASGQAVRDSLVIRGTANDVRFRSYRVEVRVAGAPSGAVLHEAAVPVTDGFLCRWNTASVPDGDYELRLAVQDSLGLVGTALVRVIVDNQPPWAQETSPAKITAAAGGDVYTTNSGVHLYFPPHGLLEDAVVTIAAVDTNAAPVELGPGVKRLLAGYEVDWSPVALRKPATLEMSYAAVGVPVGVSLVLYHANADSVWQRLGGTTHAEAKRIMVVVEEPGRYALYAETGTGVGTETLSALSFTPRVFSPRGTFANAQVGIGFTLGRAGAVTVKVYNRAGRLVRDVISSQPLGAGANLVRWDGRDGHGATVSDGLYLVSVEALGHRRTQTLAVVR